MGPRDDTAAYGAKLRYLASAFVDAQSIVPNMADIGGLLAELSDERLLPTSIQEPSSSGLVSRIGFAAEDGSVVLLLWGNRFDFARLSAVPEGSDLGDFGGFCEEAAVKLTTVLAHFQRQAHRLAAVQEGYLKDMPPDQINEIAGRVLNLPQVYRAHAPVEWDWRAVAHMERPINGLTEPTNTITTIKRAVGRFLRLDAHTPMQVDLDRIRLDFDINTLPTNLTARFNTEHVRSFFGQAGRWHADLSAEVLTFIFGR
jgi:hypothetical protein